MFEFNQKRNSRLSLSLTLCLISWGCVNPKDINWENTPITGTVLGTVEYPNQYGSSTINIRVELNSGESILVPSTGGMPIVKSQQVKLYRGATDSGKKFYSFDPPFQKE
jgi:hypothetical protein